MRRIYYVGEGPASDARLPGVELHYGCAVDVPEQVADLLVSEQWYDDEPSAPVPGQPGEDIAWYEPDPGEELAALPGVGPSRQDMLVAIGITGLADLVGLSHSEVVALADALPGVGIATVEDWVKQAEDYQEALHGNH